MFFDLKEKKLFPGSENFIRRQREWRLRKMSRARCDGT